MEQKLETKPFYKKKAVYMPVLAILTIGVAFAAGVAIASIPTTVTVGEPLSTSTVSLSVDAFPAETVSQTVAIHNAASVNEDVQLSWVETDAGGVTYTTDMPKTVTLTPGDNEVTVNFDVAHDSAIGTVTGNVDVARV